MKNTIQIVPLGGTEEIGMNMTLYIHENEQGEKSCIMVDCGIAFEDLPGANVVMPDIACIKEKGLKVEALVLTHGHEDHIGAIPYLYDKLECPIYGTGFTNGLVKRKLDGMGKKAVKIEDINCGETRKIGAFEIEWISATHSIPDNSMLYIKAGGIKVLHTGDWKLDSDPVVGRVTDTERLAQLKNESVDAMIADSTNIHEENAAHPEGDVKIALESLVKERSEGRFVLTCFSSNIARVKSCIDAGIKAGRKVLVSGSSLIRNLAIAEDLGYVEPGSYETEDNYNGDYPKDIMIICTGSQGEDNSALWKIANTKNYGGMLEAGDTLVFSARVIDGKQVGVRKIINSMVEKGISVLHPWNSKDSLIHTSGHPGQPDIKQLLSWVSPKFVIPVHSQAEHRLSHIAFAKSLGYGVFNVRDGLAIEISKVDGKTEVNKIGTFPHGKIAYDGRRLVDVTNRMFSERKQLSEAGFISIAIAMGRDKKAKISINTYGIDDQPRFDTPKENKDAKEIKESTEKDINVKTNVNDNDSENINVNDVNSKEDKAKKNRNPNEVNSKKDPNKKEELRLRDKLKVDLRRVTAGFSSLDFQKDKTNISRQIRRQVQNTTQNMTGKRPQVGVQILV